MVDSEEFPCRYTILFPEERKVVIDRHGNVMKCTEKTEELPAVSALLEKHGCLYTSNLVFMTEKDLRNVLFWSLNSTKTDSAYDSFFYDRIPYPFEVCVQDTGTQMGNGLFAAEDIPGPTSSPVVIGEYVGLLTNNVTHSAFSMAYYISSSNGFDQNWHVDGLEMGGLVRFINHSSTNHNVKFENVFFGHMWHVLVLAIRPIRKGEQLLVDYGHLYWLGQQVACI